MPITVIKPSLSKIFVAVQGMKQHMHLEKFHKKN